MSYQDQGKVVSLIAGDTLAANVVVYLSGVNTVSPAVTDTSIPVGVTADYADSGAAVAVVIDGIARCKVFSSITAGNLVSFATDQAGYIKAVTVNNTALTALPIIGIALETASTSGDIIPVLLQRGISLQR